MLRTNLNAQTPRTSSAQTLRTNSKRKRATGLIDLLGHKYLATISFRKSARAPHKLCTNSAQSRILWSSAEPHGSQWNIIDDDDDDDDDDDGDDDDDDNDDDDGNDDDAMVMMMVMMMMMVVMVMVMIMMMIC